MIAVGVMTLAPVKARPAGAGGVDGTGTSASDGAVANVVSWPSGLASAVATLWIGPFATSLAVTTQS